MLSQGEKAGSRKLVQMLNVKLGNRPYHLSRIKRKKIIFEGKHKTPDSSGHVCLRRGERMYSVRAINWL